VKPIRFIWFNKTDYIIKTIPIEMIDTLVPLNDPVYVENPLEEWCGKFSSTSSNNPANIAALSLLPTVITRLATNKMWYKHIKISKLLQYAIL